MDIGRMLKIELPQEQTKQAYSDFINANVKKYKTAVMNWKLEQELESEMKNG